MAATAASVHSMTVRPMIHVGHATSRPPTSMYLLTQQRKTSRMSVRCMASENNQDPQAQKQRSPKFLDLLAFSGPAPERINGRLAMVGFVAALGVELAQGNDLVEQLSNGGLPWFVATSALFSFASLVPLLKGVSVESKSDGVMTSNVELWNGRFAMLGLVALVFTEFVKGGALV